MKKFKIQSLKFKILFANCLLFLFLLLALSYQLPTVHAQVCQQLTKPSVKAGLITTPSLSGQFGNTGGTCAIDLSKIPFAPYEIPKYESLKLEFYTKAKATKNETPGSTVSAPANKQIYLYTNPSGVSTGLLDLSAVTTTAVIFIENNLSINGNIIESSGNGLVFVVRGDIIIAPTVTRIDAVLISEGTIYTAGVNCNTNSVTSSALTINGSVISLNPTSASAVKFCRTLTDNNLPSEKIVYQPKYLIILRGIFSTNEEYWSEITEETTVLPTPVPVPSSPPRPTPTAAPINCSSYTLNTSATGYRADWSTIPNEVGNDGFMKFLYESSDSDKMFAPSVGNADTFTWPYGGCDGSICTGVQNCDAKTYEEGKTCQIRFKGSSSRLNPVNWYQTWLWTHRWKNCNSAGGNCSSDCSESTNFRLSLCPGQQMCYHSASDYSCVNSNLVCSNNIVCNGIRTYCQAGEYPVCIDNVAGCGTSGMSDYKFCSGTLRQCAFVSEIPYSVKCDPAAPSGLGYSCIPPAPCDTTFYGDRTHGCYYKWNGNINFDIPANLLNQEDDPNLFITHNWYSDNIGNSGRNNLVAAVYRRKVTLQPGAYIFLANSDDGVDIKIALAGSAPQSLALTPAGAYNDHDATTMYASNPLMVTTAADYDMMVKYYDNNGAASLNIRWYPATTPPWNTSNYCFNYNSDITLHWLNPAVKTVYIDQNSGTVETFSKNVTVGITSTTADGFTSISTGLPLSLTYGVNSTYAYTLDTYGNLSDKNAIVFSSPCAAE